MIRSTNAGAARPNVTWADMTATLGDGAGYAFTQGLHPDQHAVVFDSADPGIAFVGSDGGVVRVDVRSPRRRARAACAVGATPATAQPLARRTSPTASGC